jgi:hypothetical protein
MERRGCAVQQPQPKQAPVDAEAAHRRHRKQPKTRLARKTRSPLTDSNRRPRPYHGCRSICHESSLRPTPCMVARVWSCVNAPVDRCSRAELSKWLSITGRASSVRTLDQAKFGAAYRLASERRGVGINRL